MEYKEDEYLLLSGIQHFLFCRRQWALIHIDGVWEENQRTLEGAFIHEKAHDHTKSESRNGAIIARGMPVFSREMGISGQCDVVEFHPSTSGVPISGHLGKYDVYPVEYKHGEPKDNECDIMQLTAQAMCLEEMLCCKITAGAIYYAAIKHRIKVEFTDELRHKVKEAVCEMHQYFERKYLPRPKRTKACNACSLKDICLPQLSKIPSARLYNIRNLSEEECE